MESECLMGDPKIFVKKEEDQIKKKKRNSN